MIGISHRFRSEKKEALIPNMQLHYTGNPTGNLNGSNVLVVLPLTKLKKSVNVSRIFKKMVNGACPQYFDDYVTFDIEGPVDFH